MREFIINENDANQRVDKFIQKTCHQMPKSLMYRLIRQKRIKVNRKRCEPNMMLNINDTIQMFISDEFFVEKEFRISSTKQLKNIVYEDDNILVLDKEVGVVVHSNEKENKDTYIQRVIKYLIETNQYNPKNENSFVPAFVNRLDQNTGGLLIACKNANSLRAMNEMIRNHEVEKHYMCIVKGRVDDGLYRHYYIKDKNNNKALIYDKQVKDSVAVELIVETIQTANNYSLLDINLITGKSHQIRAQLSHLKHPLIGDFKYGGDRIMKSQALYAYKLSFNTSNEALNYLNNIVIDKKDNFVSREFKKMVR